MNLLKKYKLYIETLQLAFCRELSINKVQYISSLQKGNFQFFFPFIYYFLDFFRETRGGGGKKV